MTELFEGAAVALAAEVVDECPFPHDDVKHDGSNDFGNNPQTLGGRLGGGAARMITVTVRGHSKSMELGFQAHHLVPGASIKGAKALRKFMTAGSTVKADIGYQQNDAWNGVWLPALHKFKGWGELTKGGGYEIQFAYAYYAMAATGRQFHMWDSSHKDYNAFVRRTLEEMRLKMIELQSDCKKCADRGKKPWDPPYRLLAMIDAVARRMNRYLTGPASRWYPPYCTSDFAVLVGAGKTPETMAAS